MTSVSSIAAAAVKSADCPSLSSNPTPLRLHIDDGSRLITHPIHGGGHSATALAKPTHEEDDHTRSSSPRPTWISISIYYEIHRLAYEIIQCLFNKPKVNEKETERDGFLCRVALQFPDILLPDAVAVTWEMEDAILDAYKTFQISLRQPTTTTKTASSPILPPPPPLVFILGDTTYSSCCPDEISALHLNADILIHYGTEACFSPTEQLPILYSFGVTQTVDYSSSCNSNSTVTKMTHATTDRNQIQTTTINPDTTFQNSSYSSETPTISSSSYYWSWDVSTCATQIFNQLTNIKDFSTLLSSSSMLYDSILIFYQPQYHREMKDLRNLLLSLFLQDTDYYYYYLQQHQVDPRRYPFPQVVIASFISQSITEKEHDDDEKVRRQETCACHNYSHGVKTNSGCYTLNSTCSDKTCEDTSSFHTFPDSSTHDHDMATTTNTATTTTNGNVDDGFVRIGNLQVPLLPHQLCQYLVIYIGDEHSQNKTNAQTSSIHTHLLHFLLRIMSYNTSTNHSRDVVKDDDDVHDNNNNNNSRNNNSSHVITRNSMVYSPKACWTYHPSTGHLSTQPLLEYNSHIRRYLNRRYYLIQRASLAQVFGILVGTLSQEKFRTVIEQLQGKIQKSGKACYTMAVGKIHQIAKLTNFAEIECFILVACSETSVLPNERDYPIPIITPHELDIALGIRTWDPHQWTCDYFDYLKNGQEQDHAGTQPSIDDGNDNDDDDDDDQPFYSLITGKYESKKPIHAKQKSLDPKTEMESLSSTLVLADSFHGGQMVEYHSEAAEFWKHREYKGLEAKVGETEVQNVIPGQTGIASDYGNR